MTTFTDTITERFHVVRCYHCTNAFGINSELYRRAVTDAFGVIYCPACGKTFGWAEPDAQKKIRELERKLQWEAQEVARQKAAKENTENLLNAQKALVSKLRNRASAGVCPCCNRTFKQLASHMKSKHPEFGR